VRTPALVIGMFGGFVGIYFALLLVVGTGLVSAIASVGGSRTAADPLVWALAALASYTLGVIGGALAIHRPGAAAALMFIGALLGVLATVMVLPSAASVFAPSAPTPVPLFAPSTSRVPFNSVGSAPSSSAFYLAIPFGGPALLIIGALLALFDSPKGAQARASSATSPAIGPAQAAEVATSASIRLLTGPSLQALSSHGSIAPGTRLDAFERHGDFIHVRGPGFEGYLPATTLRLL
jgi:hypothetical protein